MQQRSTRSAFESLGARVTELGGGPELDRETEMGSVSLYLGFVKSVLIFSSLYSTFIFNRPCTTCTTLLVVAKTME